MLYEVITVQTGELELSQLIDKTKLNAIENYMLEHPDSSLTEAKNALGNEFT